MTDVRVFAAQVFMHAYAGVLSAYGMGLADIGAVRERTVELPLEAHDDDDDVLPAVEAILTQLAAAAVAEVAAQRIPAARITVARRVLLRYQVERRKNQPYIPTPWVPW